MLTVAFVAAMPEAVKPVTESLNVTEHANEVFLVGEVSGDARAVVGAVLSTVNVVLDGALGARFPARSEAVLAAIEIRSVPSPVILEIVTVRDVVPLPDTDTEDLDVAV